jgi:hypothetical protein
MRVIQAAPDFFTGIRVSFLGQGSGPETLSRRISPGSISAKTLSRFAAWQVILTVRPILGAARKSLLRPSMHFDGSKEDANGRFLLRDVSKWFLMTIFEWILDFQSTWSSFC